MLLDFSAYRSALEVLLNGGGTAPGLSSKLAQIAVVGGLLLSAYIMGYLFRRLIVPVILKIVDYTDTKWDDYLINAPVLRALSQLVPCLIIYHLLPRCFDSGNATTFIIISRLTQAYITLCITLLVAAFLKNLSVALIAQLKEHHMTGILQFLRLLTFCMGGIVLVSQLLGYNPMRVTAGLGAMATVLMLVFKDTILGLVAGIQLSMNKMLKVGDWVTIDKLGINGTVEEISLTTVKVRNFDNTISTIPPYTLVSDSFQNWNGMVNQGARRVKRTILINMNSIRFADEGLQEQLRSKGYPAVISPANGTWGTTNLGLYRAYITHQLHSADEVEQSQWAFVRQLNPTQEGLPLELWFYLKSTAFVSYEEEASAIMEHFMAVLPEFGLELFQAPTGADIKRLSNAEGAKESTLLDNKNNKI